MSDPVPKLKWVQKDASDSDQDHKAKEVLPDDSQLPSPDAEGIVLNTIQMPGPEVEGSIWTVFGIESVMPEAFLMNSQAPSLYIKPD